MALQIRSFQIIAPQSYFFSSFISIIIVAQCGGNPPYLPKEILNLILVTTVIMVLGGENEVGEKSTIPLSSKKTARSREHLRANRTSRNPSIVAWTPVTLQMAQTPSRFLNV